VAATVIISVRMTSPIGEMIGYINRIELGNMDVDIRVRGNDELSSLARRFKSMMHTINELFVREYRLEVANKTNELKALQAQINPHFLNNALQSIGHVALQQGNRQVYSLIASLGKMMRYGMNTNETIVPLKEEMDYVKTYLKLQKLRFREQFQQQIECAPEAEAILVPKMILQPIVENYFKHGFQGVESEGLIVVKCTISDDGQTLRIEVSDNGSGIEDEKLADLRSRLSGSQPVLSERGDFIGLVNVVSRLKLYYRNNAEMSVDQVDPQGFRVSLSIPIFQSSALPNAYD
jgi:two-component system, sensor histidine kinase YesM